MRIRDFVVWSGRDCQWDPRSYSESVRTRARALEIGSDETSGPVVLHLASPNGPRKPTTGNAQQTETQSRIINHTLHKDDLQQLSNKPLNSSETSSSSYHHRRNAVPKEPKSGII